MFAEMSGGLAKIFGPTGGYLLSYIPTVYITGLILEKTRFSVAMAFLANIIGMFITLIIGTIWLKYMSSLSWTVAFSSGFAPFIIVGILKAFLASWLGITIRSRLASANMLPKKNTPLSQ